MYRIRQALIDIGAENPHLRPKLRPVIKSAAWEKLPKGWTQGSVEKFWASITGGAKHKVTKCISKMEGKFDDPGAFCASLADKATGDTSWRGKKADEMNSKGNMKTALAPRAVLAQVFAGHKPFVKNWVLFLRTLETDLKEWPLEWTELTGSDFKIGSTAMAEWVGSQIQGTGWYSPPEYQEGEIEVAESVLFQLNAVLSTHDFPQNLWSQYSTHIHDAQGFKTATVAMLRDLRARTLFAKLLRPFLERWFRDDPTYTVEGFDEVLETARDYSHAEYGFSGATFGAIQVGASAEGLKFSAPVRVELNAEVSAPERDFDEPDDYDRYASSAARVAAAWLQKHPRG